MSQAQRKLSYAALLISVFNFCLRSTTEKEHSFWEQIPQTVSDSDPTFPGFC